VLSSSDEEGGLSDSDLESSSNDDGCISGDEQCLSTNEHNQYDDINEQRLLAYKKEGMLLRLDLQEVPRQNSGRSIYILNYNIV
jgi:hypothetical protein